MQMVLGIQQRLTENNCTFLRSCTRIPRAISLREQQPRGSRSGERSDACSLMHLVNGKTDECVCIKMRRSFVHQKTERAAPCDAMKLGESIDRRMTLRDYGSNALAKSSVQTEKTVSTKFQIPNMN